MNENEIATEESIVPVIIATAVVSVAAVIAVKGLVDTAKMIRKNSKERKRLAKIAAEETN